MERSKLLRADYLDILFDGRNKTYGGYELRAKYEGRARRATLAVVFGVALVSAIPRIADALSTETPVLRPVGGIIQLPVLDLPKPEVQPPLPQLTSPTPPPAIAAPVFHIVEDEQAPTPPAAVEDMSRAQVSISTSEGIIGDPGITPAGPAGGGTSIVETPAPTKEIIHTFVEQQPQFPGDLQAFLQSALRYPETAKESGEEGRVGIQFVVNEDGSISAAEVLKSATPLLDAEALRVVRSMPRWKPGKQNGKEVKVYFSLPVTFKLD